MSWKGRTLAVLIVAAVLAALAWLVSRPSDPLFHGQKESVWVLGLNTDLRYDLAVEWHDFGTAAVPVLIKALRKGSGPVEGRYLELWPKLPGVLQRRLSRPVDYWQARNNAAVLLRDLGAGAKNAAPALVRAMNDRHQSVRISAAMCLENLMPLLGNEKKRFVNDFLAAANDTNYVVRADAMAFLAYYPNDSPAAAPQLVKALDDPERTVRAGAMQALNAMNPEAAARAGVVPLLLKQTHNQDAIMRAFVARRLGAIRHEPKTVVPALMELLGDDAPVVRFAAATALGRFGNEAVPAIPALVKLLEAPEPPIRTAVSNALAQINPAAVVGGVTPGRDGAK